MKKPFRIKTEADQGRVISMIRSIEPNKDKPVQVLITEGQDLRSIAQNSLYWKHIGELHNHKGLSKHDIHWKLKKRYLHPIYMAGDTAKNLVYQANYQALLTIHNSKAENSELDRIDLELLHKKILTTKDATVKQFWEYMQNYWVDMNQEGIQLTDPESFMEANT